MKTAIQIVQLHLIPKLGKVTDLDINILNEIFWINFTKSLLSFETDGKSLYQLFLDLNISPEIKEKIISKIPGTFSILISELAEEYVKGNNSEAINLLLNSKGKLFKEEVDFFRTLNEAVNIIERKRRKEELPFMFEKLQKKYLDGDI
jgi:hypothetical protein